MARSFGKLLCEVWDDPRHADFLALSSDAKVLYWAFCSQRDITAAGIVPLTPRRWRRWFPGGQQAAESALDELVAGGFVMIDDDTAEVWVRSFIAHDGRLEGNSNMVKSVHAAVPRIVSEVLREACRRRIEAVETAIEGRSNPVPPDDPEPPGRTPFERGSNRIRTPFELAGAASHEPELRASSREPEPSGESATFDAVVDAIVGLRLQQERGIRHPTRYAASLRRDLPAEHGDTIRHHLERYPDAPVSCIAGAVVSGDTRQLAGWAS